MILSEYAKLAYVSPENMSFWFGYYNYSPENYDGTKVLAQHVNFDGRSIKKEDQAEIGWLDVLTGEWNPIGTTRAFNWQQGAMLQWLEDGNSFIYNDAEDGQFISKEFTISSGKTQVHPWPVYGIDKKRGISVSLQFKRCYWCRAYHYESISDESWDGLLPLEDGIFLLDLKNNTTKRIIKIEDIVNVDAEPSFKQAKHWVEHIMINPSGSRFAFYHRYTYESGFVTRVFTANIDGTDIRIIDGWRDFSWSHMGWINDHEFAIYGVKKNQAVQAYRKITEEHGRLGKLLRLVYKKTLSKLISKQVRKRTASLGTYQMFDCISGQMIDEIDIGIFPIDGHPSFTKDGRYMLTDTYEDENMYRHLYIYDMKLKKKVEIAKFYSPFNSCDYRSDLHPRFNPKENRIIVDSAHSGYHRIVGIAIDWVGIKRSLCEE